MEKKTLLYLPHDLIIQILMRLPVKSLICFKCVCKLWFSLISDPNFANSHFQLTAAKHTRRFLCLSTLSPEIRSIDFDAWLNDDSASLNLNFSLHKSYFPFKIKGSCRGFIFLYRRPDIYLWNPSIGFNKHIPVSSFDSKFPYDNLYGFGYDQSRDDYVVVVLSRDLTIANVVSSHLEVFSFRYNIWKEIEGTHFPYIADHDHRNGLLFNGAIHWLASRHDLDCDVIVAFDIMERKLVEMPLPNNFDTLLPSVEESGLWVFGEFLSLWILGCDSDTIAIWVMKEYKVHSSWNKTLVFPLDVIPNNLYVSLMYSTKNGEIIIVTNDGTILVKYNDKGQLLEHRSFCNRPSKVIMYTETLLSLPGDN